MGTDLIIGSVEMLSPQLVSSDTETQYGFFVYGTLRPGLSNYRRLLQNVTVNERVVSVPGYVLYNNQGLYPFAVESSQDNKIVATYVTIVDEKYASTLKNLDFLEGYDERRAVNDFYCRELITVPVGDEKLVGHIYVAASSVKNYIEETFLPKVPYGDWYNINQPY